MTSMSASETRETLYPLIQGVNDDQNAVEIGAFALEPVRLGRLQILADCRRKVLRRINALSGC